MSYRYDDLVPGESYHVFTRGVEQRNIFRHDKDRRRFSELLLHCLPAVDILSYSMAKKLKRDPMITREGAGLVDLLSYCLMSNHIHLLLRENSERGISRYMQRLLTAYAKYFNMSEERSGSLFVNPFRAVLINGDDQLLHVSRYIHLNPYSAQLVSDPFGYAWSSLSEYISMTSPLTCHVSIIRGLLKPADYRNFILDEADNARSLAEVKHLLVDY